MWKQQHDRFAELRDHGASLFDIDQVDLNFLVILSKPFAHANVHL